MNKLQFVTATLRSPWTIPHRGQMLISLPKSKTIKFELSTKTSMISLDQRSFCTLPEIRLWRSQSSLLGVTRTNLKQNVMKRFSDIANQGVATYKPTPFQQRVLVMSKIYPSVEQVPERVTRQQMKRAMDKFRIRVSIFMVAFTFIFAAIMALVGRKERNEGQSVTGNALARRKSLSGD